MSFISELKSAFQENSNSEMAVAMEKYMRNHFIFFGIKTTERRAIFKTILKQHKEEVSRNSRKIAWDLFVKKQRELHYCAIEILMQTLKKNYIKEDIQLIEKLLITHSWWDSVDTISKFILGEYLLEFPEETTNVIERFSNSDNMWLNRSALLFQLGYKQKTNAEILFSECIKHSDSSAFFIQKAIGWALREYGKTNPELVKTFVNQTNLKPLSKKEALKNLH
ncbi:DNA alkylation repair protein [Flavobacterium psychrotolerans]|uniref:DNA alkylation repair protein n=1 Tax=Flavobacterium psychrotolerans TaxID=2169410 RepID=A0A2U1JGV2_9FLAO|nr:DNA alkylation repair protein [Flavobacterium psychrotolerans]PWA04234.1 DNA alkylation repair protein [Flavobacterium psychrotolerans]